MADWAGKVHRLSKEEPAEGLPRERLLRGGPSTLEDHELLALLLGSGHSGHPVHVLAGELLREGGGLKALVARELEELCQLPGLGPARAARIVAALELGRRAQRATDPRPRLTTPQEIYQHLAPTLSVLPREVFHVLCFNSRNILLKDARISVGSTNACPVDPREVFEPALRCKATAVVLAHNHPAGDPEPSTLDVALTRQLERGGQLLGIRVLDHLIIGDGTFTSLLERGALFPGDWRGDGLHADAAEGHPAGLSPARRRGRGR